jgi:hypothetical protein
VAQIPDLFVASASCIACHNALVTPSGEDVSIGADWRGSMMANAARDPYWHAAVKREILVHPSAQAAIEDKCSSCHMPMTRFTAKANGETGQIFAHLPVGRGAGPSDLLAADGVSCSLCHQIEDEGLGSESSFTAGFHVDLSRPLGERQAYGPFEVDEGRQRLMQSASQLVPVEGQHVRSSELCASCHTVFTHALGPDGEEVGELPEQVPYLEWRHSAYGEQQVSCQSCHMPEVEGAMHVTGVLGVPRENVSRHLFKGGNFFMPRLLDLHRKELGVQALPQELETVARGAAEHLETATARVAVEDLRLVDDRLRVVVRIGSEAGHKLPSAYPSRRVWIHLTVHDARGKVVFESGRFQADGSIAGNDNDEDGARYEPHYREIERPDQVQIYEAIMADFEGALTTVLLSGVRYVKDNRLLPDGFDKTTAGDDIAVLGRAAVDQDFRDGGDAVRYSIPVSASDGPFVIAAELWYQPIAYRWAQNLADQEAPVPRPPP